MATSTVVKAFALVLFIAGIAGATYAVMGVMGDTVQSSLVSASASRTSLNATGGHNVTFLVTISNRDSSAHEVFVEATGVVSGTSATTTVRGGSNATVFLTVQLPADISVGEHPLGVRLTSDGNPLRERDLLTLNIMPDAPGFDDGDSAQIIYTGRLSATGRVFNANDLSLVGLSFPKTDTYRFSDGALNVQTRPRLTVVTGLAQGMVGMQSGESRTVSFPPALGYGPSAQNQTFDRDEILTRELTVPNQEQAVARQTFDAYIRESRQGDPATMGPGDHFKLDQDGNVWPYRITNMTADLVQYKLDAQPGDAFTVYPFWKDASVVTAIDEQNITFRTTPNTPEGKKITLKSFWPEMSAVKEINETHIVLRHSPPVGFSFTQVISNAPREATVRDVSETTITAVMPSTNPLAGKDLTFDVTVLSLTKRG